MAQRWSVMWPDGAHTFELEDSWGSRTLRFDALVVPLGAEVTGDTSCSYPFEIAGHKGAVVVPNGLGARAELHVDGQRLMPHGDEAEEQKSLSARLRTYGGLTMACCVATLLSTRGDPLNLALALFDFGMFALAAGLTVAGQVLDVRERKTTGRDAAAAQLLLGVEVVVFLAATGWAFARVVPFLAR